MAIKVTGAGHLILNARIINAFPGSVLMWGTRDVSTGNQVWLSQGDAANLSRVRLMLPGSNDTKAAQHVTPGGSAYFSNKTAAPHANTTLQLFAGVYTGTNSRTVYFGDGTGVTNIDGLSTLDNWSTHNTLTIGAQKISGAAASELMKGSFAEAHFYSVALTATDIANLLAGTVKPEEIVGWIDGWTFKDYNASGEYVSIGGTRTMSAVGTVETSTATGLPFTRASTDVTAPVLTLPVGASSGTTTATGSVTTNEGNGTLYKLTSTNATETSATIIASGATQTVISAGVQNVTSSALTASTTYYHHFAHKDAATNTSNVVSSAAFTTSAAGDTTAPVLSSPTATPASSTTATGTVSTNEANGALYRYASTNATETAGTIKAANQFQAVTVIGVQNVSMSGLPQATANLRIHYVHRDAAGNDSNVVSSAAFTTPAGTAGSLTFTEQFGNSTTGPLASTTCTALIYNIAGQIVATRTGLATDANARLVNQIITDAAMSTGTNYRTIFVFASGAEGMINRVAA